MGVLLRQAEDLLDVAAGGDGGWASTAIVLDRRGGLRMLDAAGWSLAALKAEFGATAVFTVERRGPALRVEAWDGVERCLVERRAPCARLADLAAILPAATWQPLCPLLR